MAAEERVIVFTLPPNTTHLSQPLDKGVFGLLKVAWRRVCNKYLSDHPGHVIHHYVFSRLLSSAWIEAMTILAFTQLVYILLTEMHAFAR